MKLTAARLVEACSDDSVEGGLCIKANLQPLGGPGSPVKPAVYEGGKYQQDRRWVGIGAEASAVDAVVVDNVPSQANRLEAALDRHRKVLGLPSIVIDLSEWTTLPPHLPRQLSSFRLPHRQADAYLRDATLDGVPFAKAPVGAALFNGTADRPEALVQWFPQTLLYGFWQSHLGNKRSQAKLARSWVSEITGLEPATVDTRIFGAKGDPLNLSISEKVSYDENDEVGIPWQLTDEKKSAVARGQKKQDSLSNVGHGQAIFDGAPAAISFHSIQQQATLSLASLRRIWFGDAATNAAGRGVVAALGIVAHAAAFGGAFNLRSGCDLRTTAATWTWLGGSTDEEVEPITLEAATHLFQECVSQAERSGLPVGSKWQTEPLILKPNPELEKVIRRSWPVDN
ncbi:MAG TPA: type I-U CRISPR-associated RAMP protein Csb1/Cas7u [Actinomycetota bacterium]|nr:type I-U CRISPR-associated RAMP protein Csb1/Cas7u [Actinomycetota bacterium]